MTNLSKLNRDLHRWASVLVALPVAVIIGPSTYIGKSLFWGVPIIFGFVGNVSAQEQVTRIATLPATFDIVQRIAFGSCAKHWQHQPIWETVIAKKPNVFLFLGDAIYADTDGTTAWSVTEKQLPGEWNRLADKREFQRFRSTIPMMATWDNHDYGTHNGGAEFELKEVSKRLFLDFFGEPQQSQRRQRAGIYDAKVFGPQGQRVQIILLDTRTFRGLFKLDERSKEQRDQIGKVGKYVPHEDASVPLLGEAQWTWLQKQLLKPAEVRLICSSTQIIANEKGMDEWGCFPRERQRLFDLIDATDATGVILLSGNVHFAEISEVATKKYPLLDFTSSGLTHISESYAKAANEFRVAGPSIELNFGFVEIDWTAKPSAQITLKAITADGSTGFTHRVSLNALR
jgi:alkaline phosphatase D